jgi:2,4'-dihydroxyacetophenone dioxygenase
MKYESKNFLSPLFAFLATTGMTYRSVIALSSLTGTPMSMRMPTVQRNAMQVFQSTTTTDTPTAVTVSMTEEFMPYQGDQPKEALPEIFVPQIFCHTLTDGQQLDDERLWVPQTNSVSFRPLCFCVSSGYYVNLLRVRGSGLLSRHRHPGPVHGHVLKGRWRYLEHDWEAIAGSYVFEPPGEIHTLVVPDGVDEMITLFHVTGSLLYCDPNGKVTGAEDVFSKLELAKRHYSKVGLGEDFVQQFVR